MHSDGFVHRDIKPENILWSKTPADVPILKIADFGLSKDVVYESAAKTNRGTTCYKAPEVFSGNG